MALRRTTLLACIAMALLTVLWALDFFRALSAYLSDAVALGDVFNAAIHMLAGLSLTIFLYSFHEAQN